MNAVSVSQFRFAYLSILPVLFLSLSAFAQIRYDAIEQEHFDLRAPVHRFVLPAPIVKHFTFGFQHVLADYYWVTAIQDFAKWDRFDFYYPEYFRIIATLDPKFAYPYEFAALTIPSKQNSTESLKWLSEIAQLGMNALPESWEIPFYVGLQYHIVGKSYQKSTEYLEIATKKPGRPSAVETTYALYLLRSSTEYQRSRALFTAIAETTDNVQTKKIAEDRIALLDLIEMIDRASVSYKTKFNRYPNSIEILEEKGYISLTPELVKRFQVAIDPVSGKATFK